MPRLLRLGLLLLSALTFLAPASAAPDRATATQRVRAELATILKTEPAKLPVDKPVLELGADELDVVEWVMAIEEAFNIQIHDEKIVDPKTERTRKDFSIASMVALVLASPERPPSDQPLAALLLKTPAGEPVGFLVTYVKPLAPGRYAGECAFMLAPKIPASRESELGRLFPALNAAGQPPCRIVIADDQVEIIVTPPRLPEVRIVLPASGAAGSLSIIKGGTPQKIGLAERAKK